MKVIYDFKWDFFNVRVWLLWVLMVGNGGVCLVVVRFMLELGNVEYVCNDRLDG